MNIRLAHNALGKVLLIVAVSAGLLTLAVYQTRGLVGGSDRLVIVQEGTPVLQPVPGSRFIRSYPVTVNGLKTEFGHYTSRQPSREVVQAYASELGRGAGTAAAAAHAPALSSLGADRAALSYVTQDGATIGIIAYDNRETGGCEYFIGSVKAHSASPAPKTGDVPGREPPGVPKPARSTRTLCIENLGGLNSLLVFYDAWGRPSEIAADLSAAMAEAHWKPRTESSRLLTRNYEGSALLSFVRGHEQCLVGIDQEPKSGKIIVMVFWAERPWLPEGTAL